MVDDKRLISMMEQDLKRHRKYFIIYSVGALISLAICILYFVWGFFWPIMLLPISVWSLICYWEYRLCQLCKKHLENTKVPDNQQST